MRMSSKVESSWTASQKAALVQYWKTTTTCKEIGGLCGDRTKNAVVAQAHRMKLGNKIMSVRRGQRLNTPTPAKLTLVATVRPPSGLILALSAEPPVHGPLVGLEHLGPGMCRWPVGDPQTPEFGFCGCAANDVYCERHSKTARHTKSDTERAYVARRGSARHF
jgi:GcrA cell cycle regulator